MWCACSLGHTLAYDKTHPCLYSTMVQDCPLLCHTSIPCLAYSLSGPNCCFKQLLLISCCVSDSTTANRCAHTRGRRSVCATTPGGIGADTDILKTPKAELTVRNPVFWLRLYAMGDLGFVEAYMYGEIDCDDLAKVFQVCLLPFRCLHGCTNTSHAQVFLANRAELSTLDNSLLSRIMTHMPQVGLGSYIMNTIANARKNISAHYDISNNMFMGEPSLLYASTPLARPAHCGAHPTNRFPLEGHDLLLRDLPRARRLPAPALVQLVLQRLLALARPP